ncbi:MAG: hypothetical protein [Bacteriophage sp.]|nr:MAG: hypothetical protein [Bacteriophage sp.]
MEHNQQATDKAAIDQIGNYAVYLTQVGESVGKFAISDIIRIAQLALQTGELEEALRMAGARNEQTIESWKSEVDGLVNELSESRIAVQEARNDVRNAEAHSEELNDRLKANEKACNMIAEARDKFKALSTEHFDRMEAVRGLFEIADTVGDEEVIAVIENRLNVIKTTKDNNVAACMFWYDAWDSVRAALDVDLDGLSDDEKVKRVLSAARHASAAVFEKRNDALKIHLDNLRNALQLDAGFTNDAMVEQARQIRQAADSKVAQECEWQRRYNELCNVMGIEASTHDEVMIEARDIKDAVVRGNKQDNYQRKYNELKGAAGLAGVEHKEAVKIMARSPARD